MRKLITFPDQRKFRQFVDRLPKGMKNRCHVFPRMHMVSMDMKDYNRLKARISSVSATKGVTVEDDRPYNVHARDFIPWGIKRVNAPQVWPILRGSGVRVGVLDTGIDRTHPELSARVKGGVDLVEGKNPFLDLNGHGTHVSGTIAASLNKEGVAGVAPDVSLYSIRAFGADGSAFTSDIIRGINWAIENKMDVLNMSFGSQQGSVAEKRAIQTAYQAGIFMVASAGNSGGGVDYPGRYPEVVAVGAIGKNNRVPAFSNRGKYLDFVEPGVKVLSTWPGGSFRRLSGTSMSAAHLSGIAALYRARYRGRSPDEIYQLLKKASVRLSVPKSSQGLGLVVLTPLVKKRA